MKRVDQACCTNDCRAMLIIMKNRNVHFLFQTLLNDKALWCLNILKIDSTKGGAHQPYSLTELIWIFGIQFDVDAVHIRKAFK